MNYGLYLSAAGTLANMHRQDVYANNLANVNTVGFKPDSVFTKQRLPERLESPGAFIDPQHLLERLGGGQFIEPTQTAMTQGELTRSDNPLDLGIQGNGFFVVATGAGTGPDHQRLTRDGRFTMNENGQLVMTTTGMRVLDVNDQPIRLNPSQHIEINRDGEISQGGNIVARLQLADPSNPSQIRKAGENLYRFREGATPNRVPADGRILQGHVEGSAVDPILAMNAMIGAAKSAMSNSKLMQYHDHIMGEAINTFGRVA